MPASYLTEFRRMNEDELDAALFGLAVECPYGDCPRVCPLTPLRARPLRERFQTINALSPGGKLKLMTKLVDCFLTIETAQTAAKNT